MPQMTVGRFSSAMAALRTDWSVTNSFIWQDTVALTKGRHSMRFGARVQAA